VPDESLILQGNFGAQRAGFAFEVRVRSGCASSNNNHYSWSRSRGVYDNRSCQLINRYSLLGDSFARLARRGRSLHSEPSQEFGVPYAALSPVISIA